MIFRRSACSSRASDPNTPAATLAKLAINTDDYIRWCVANNPSAPADALTTLAQDVHNAVRLAIAHNPHTPAPVLTTLSTDAYGHVRSAVSVNPNTPTHVIRLLSTDRTRDVADHAVAIGRINCLNRYADTLSEPGHTHARLLIDNGFPGWPDQLATGLTNRRRHISPPTTASRTVRPAASAQPASSVHSHRS